MEYFYYSILELVVKPTILSCLRYILSESINDPIFTPTSIGMISNIHDNGVVNVQNICIFFSSNLPEVQSFCEPSCTKPIILKYFCANVQSLIYETHFKQSLFFIRLKHDFLKITLWQLHKNTLRYISESYLVDNCVSKTTLSSQKYRDQKYSLSILKIVKWLNWKQKELYKHKLNNNQDVNTL